MAQVSATPRPAQLLMVEAAPPRGGRLVRSLSRSGKARFGLTVLLLVILAALFAPLIAPHDPTIQDITKRLVPPLLSGQGDPAYPLGTDHLGRDVLSRLIYGARISLIVGLCAVLVRTVIGVGLGLLAGFFRGRVDALIMRLADI